MFASRKEAQDARWFSRRHQTNEANAEARERYGTRKARRQRRQDSAQAREHVRSLMHPHAKLALLDGRPGNSTKERARLHKELAES